VLMKVAGGWTYHSVFSPVPLAAWMMGLGGRTVGMGRMEEVAKTAMGSIMMVESGVEDVELEDGE
jgi:hypothetical protein